jgi:hypothetical protein
VFVSVLPRQTPLGSLGDKPESSPLSPVGSLDKDR